MIVGARLVLACATVLLGGLVATTADAKHHHRAHHPEPREEIPVPIQAPRETGDDNRENSGFAKFLDDFRAEAIAAGIKRSVYDRATSGISLNARVQELNAFQPEFSRAIWDYLDGAVSDVRIAKGEEMLDGNSALFARLEKKYGVPRETLAAIWGVETGYGQSQGSFNLFEALATLAYEGTRVEYGRRQLLAALKIAQSENLDPKEMTGSWAGAFGHTQFVPTTFLDHAVDGDGDGVRDLSTSLADALASTASYLNASGWQEGGWWGEEVLLPKDFLFESADPELRKSKTEWGKLGLTNTNGQRLSGDQIGAIYLPAGYRGPAFLTLGNFDALLTYNTAASYALAIGLLSDRLRGRVVRGLWPRDEQPLGRDQIIELQKDLAALGYDAGNADGLIGNRTRAAIRKYQKAHQLPADGFATMDLFYKILGERAKQQPAQ